MSIRQEIEDHQRQNRPLDVLYVLALLFMYIISVVIAVTLLLVFLIGFGIWFPEPM